MDSTFNIKQPETEVLDKEEEKLFYKFCTFYTLYKGKKLNFVNMFLLLLSNKYERNFFKYYLSLNSDYEVVSIFLKYVPRLSKSKYITKRINKGNFYHI